MHLNNFTIIVYSILTADNCELCCLRLDVTSFQSIQIVLTLLNFLPIFLNKLTSCDFFWICFKAINQHIDKKLKLIFFFLQKPFVDL